MRIFPKLRIEEELSLNPESVLAGLLLAMTGTTSHRIELLHISSSIAGPSTDNDLVRADDLREQVQSSERLLNRLGLEGFVRQANEILTEKQKLAALVTVMDLCILENSQLDGDKAVFARVRDSFGVTEDELRPFEEMLILKNEASIRLSVLPRAYNRAAEGFRSLV